MRSLSRTASDEPRPGRQIALFSLVELIGPQVTRDGRVLPGRTSGTIVEILAGGRAYMVEVTTPFEALLTLESGSVRPMAREAV